MEVNVSVQHRGVPAKDDISKLEAKWGCTRCANGFVYGALAKNKGKYYIMLPTFYSDNDGCIIEVVPSTVGRCTGRSDFYGDMIYEGDLIKDLRAIETFSGFGGYTVKYDKDLNKFYCTASNDVKDFNDISTPVIIGNVSNDNYVGDVNGESVSEGSKVREYIVTVTDTDVYINGKLFKSGNIIDTKHKGTDLNKKALISLASEMGYDPYSLFKEIIGRFDELKELDKVSEMLDELDERLKNWVD